MPIESPVLLDQKLRAVRMLVLDVDGVLTDGRLILGDDGQEYKAFHSRDGHGLRMLQQTGVQIALLTGRRSEVVVRRAADLGINYVIQGRRDKRIAFEELLVNSKMTAETVAFAGDDILDLPVMRHCGVGIAVADASPLVLDLADWTTQLKGGRGAVREICERIMRVQGTLDAMLSPYLA